MKMEVEVRHACDDPWASQPNLCENWDNWC